VVYDRGELRWREVRFLPAYRAFNWVMNFRLWHFLHLYTSSAENTMSSITTNSSRRYFSSTKRHACYEKQRSFKFRSERNTAQIVTSRSVALLRLSESWKPPGSMRN